MPARHSVFTPDSIPDAVRLLASGASPLGGATWVMRAPVRGETLASSWVSLANLPGLRGVDVAGETIAIGAAVTHAALAAALDAEAGCTALVQAARAAANPAIREVATVGGNLCTAAFAAADLVPALLALAAEVEIATTDGTQRHDLAEFLARRTTLTAGWLLTRILVPRGTRPSAHARLPLRKAGDYPVAIVSLSLAHGPDGVVTSPRIAVGSVEAVARRWRSLEAALDGGPLDPAAAAEAARRLSTDFVGREGVEAPGWYRVEVLPPLVRSALSQIQSRSRGRP